MCHDTRNYSTVHVHRQIGISCDDTVHELANILQRDQPIFFKHIFTYSVAQLGKKLDSSKHGLRIAAVTILFFTIIIFTSHTGEACIAPNDYKLLYVMHFDLQISNILSESVQIQPLYVKICIFSAHTCRKMSRHQRCCHLGLIKKISGPDYSESL